MSTDREAGGQLSQRLTPPSPLPLPPTHTLIYDHGFSYLEEVAVCYSLSGKHAHLFCFLGYMNMTWIETRAVD